MSDDARPLIDNPYRASHTPIIAGDVNVTDLMARAWDRGFAAGDERLRSDFQSAASPDERLREALALVYVMLTGAEPMWAEMPLDERCARAANEAQQAVLAAADREKPDKPHTQDCQDAMFMHHAATGGDMECTCRPPVSDDPTGITRPTPEPDRRARFGRIAPHVSDDPVNDPETNT